VSRYRPPFVHPYIPNSAPEVFDAMLDAVGVKEIDELFEAVPEHLRSGHERLAMAGPYLAEADLWRHLSSVLKKNKHTDDYVCFLGGGAAKHYVPAVCDELVKKPEFYSAFLGYETSDPGKHQVWWEYQSMLCDLLEMEITGWGSHCGATAASSAILMAGRLNAGRPEALLPGNLSPDRRSVIHEVCRAVLDIKYVAMDPETGLLDMDDYKAKLSDRTAVVYLENPTYLGGIEHRAGELCKLAHDCGALVAVSVNPISLGLLETPRKYGADIACGDMQPCGIHLQYGGGNLGFVACPDHERYANAYPFMLVSATTTTNPGEQGYAVPNFETSSYSLREKAGDITSTNAMLWTVAAGAYLAQMGPRGMREIGETIIANTHYAKQRLAAVKGIRVLFSSTPFMEFVVCFDDSGKQVKQVNKALLDHGIFGGHDISKEYPSLGQSALYCFTEMISKQDIDHLAGALEEVLR